MVALLFVSLFLNSWSFFLFCVGCCCCSPHILAVISTSLFAVCAVFISLGGQLILVFYRAALPPTQSSSGVALPVSSVVSIVVALVLLVCIMLVSGVVISVFSCCSDDSCHCSHGVGD